MPRRVRNRVSPHVRASAPPRRGGRRLSGSGNGVPGDGRRRWAHHASSEARCRPELSEGGRTAPRGARREGSQAGRKCASEPEAHSWARLGSARLGSARLGSARLGSARLGSARLGSARLLIISFAASPGTGAFKNNALPLHDCRRGCRTRPRSGSRISDVSAPSLPSCPRIPIYRYISPRFLYQMSSCCHKRR